MNEASTFLKELYHHLRQSLSKYPQVEVQRRVSLETPGQPRSFWPTADILIHDAKLQITFIVQDVDDATIVRRLAQCWPYLEASGPRDTGLIQVWQHGAPTGGDRDLARFLGEKLQDTTHHFRYMLVWRKGHPASTVGGRIIAKMNLIVADFEDMKAAQEAIAEYEKTGGRPLEEVVAEIEKARGLRD